MQEESGKASLNNQTLVRADILSQNFWIDQHILPIANTKRMRRKISIIFGLFKGLGTETSQKSFN